MVHRSEPKEILNRFKEEKQQTNNTWLSARERSFSGIFFFQRGLDPLC